ncbi:MAG: LD-carboxypeptidase [Vicinamibacterales bacterium]
MILDRPRRLGAGSRLAVIAPSSPFSPDDLQRGLDELRRLGFDPLVDERIFERRAYTAGSPAVRAAVIHDALVDSRVEALIAARGGYGSAQVVPLLDDSILRRSRKAIIGHSDLTAILQTATQRCGLVAMHGPMVAGGLARGAEGYDSVSLLGALTSAEPLGLLQPDGMDVLSTGEARGVLVGGTLTQLCASLGTRDAFDPPDGAVLLIEDVNERPYRLDRMLTQLAQAGVLARAAAIVFGQFPYCDEPRTGLDARAVVSEFIKDVRIPVLWGFPTGHVVGSEWTLPLGLPVQVLARSSTPGLVFEETATAG